MNRIMYIAIVIFVLSVCTSIIWFAQSDTGPVISSRMQPSSSSQKAAQTAPPVVTYVTPPQAYALKQSRFVSQSFNNCGPASLSMVMSMFGKDVDQETLADRMRPFHNPAGGVDDKSIFAQEFVTYAEVQGFKALQRPNGDIELLKKFVANDIPVVVRTWLHPDEDIGHFRIVRGYDENAKTLTQDDSYQGPNLTYSYDEFMSMWQPFNYGYILVYPPEKQAVVEAILGDQMNEKVAYTASIKRANQEITSCHPESRLNRENQREGSRQSDSSSSIQNDTTCMNESYSYFNIASASYYLGNYPASVTNYEKAASGLPSRMLWYQIEPIQAYKETGADQTVFDLTDSILNNGNLAYSELYQIRGEVYQKQGKSDLAKSEFEKAIQYNENFQPAKDSLKNF